MRRMFTVPTVLATIAVASSLAACQPTSSRTATQIISPSSAPGHCSPESFFVDTVLKPNKATSIPTVNGVKTINVDFEQSKQGIELAGTACLVDKNRNTVNKVWVLNYNIHHGHQGYYLARQAGSSNPDSNTGASDITGSPWTFYDGNMTIGGEPQDTITFVKTASNSTTSCGTAILRKPHFLKMLPQCTIAGMVVVNYTGRH